MKKRLLFISAVLSFAVAKSQTNSFPATGNVGIATGSTTPAYRLHAVSGASNTVTIAATNADYNFILDRVNGTMNFQPVIGLPEIGAGLVNYNDGYVYTMGAVIQNKLVWNISASATSKIFRINAAENNLGNYSLEMRNNGNYAYAGGDWLSQPATAIITAWNHGLTLGVRGGQPLRILSDGGNTALPADIFIQGYKVGIGTETPNANAKLDVNGNIYSNGKIFIGTPDASTATKISPYSLAVNGTAMFNKAMVKLYASWPDYVFSPSYKLTSLDSLEEFIHLNHHLPEVPSSDQVEKNGIDLGNNQALLLKKIEELTLIVIGQNRSMKELKEEVDNTKNKVKELQSNSNIQN